MEVIVNGFIYLLIVGCIFGLLLYLLSILPVPEPFKGWLRIGLIVLVVVVIIFWLLSLLGGVPHFRLR